MYFGMGGMRRANCGILWLASCSVFSRCFRSWRYRFFLEWATEADEVDAGPERTAILSTEADSATLRSFAQLAEWLLHEGVGDCSPLAVAVEDRLASFQVGVL